MDDDIFMDLGDRIQTRIATRITSTMAELGMPVISPAWDRG
jgi:hypothetical protein